MDAARKLAEFYDYIEVMPKKFTAHLIETDLFKNESDLEDIISQPGFRDRNELGKVVVSLQGMFIIE